tara:strand:+ start:1567 stop:3135 length:1569 start_codon:yes stop_codon:yes gene_type:complete
MNGNKDQIMTAYGTLQSAQKNIAGIDPRTDEAYSDMVLFRTEANPSQRDLLITLVYETATASFVKAQDDKVELRANGRQSVTRRTIAKTGTSLPSVTIGTTSITVNSISCVLASREIDENDAFIVITEIYTEPGESSRSTRVGPTSLAGTEQVTITSVGSTAVTLTETDDIKLVNKQDQNSNGFTTFIRSYIKGVDASSTTNSYTSGRTYKINSTGNYSSVGGPSTGVVGDYFQATGSATLGGSVTAFLVGQIIGTKVSYENIISVKVPGTVKCVTHDAVGDLATNVTNSNKSQATIESVPPNTIKIKATVTESIQTSVPTISTLAYNLDDISCSVSRIGTTYRETAGPTVSTGNGVITLTGVQRNASLSTNNSYYPGSYVLDNDNSAIAVTAAVKGRQYRIISAGNTDFTAIGSANSTANTVFVATGAGSGTGTVRDFGSEGKLTYQSSETPRSTGDTSSTTDTGQSDTITTIITKGTTSQSDGSAPSSYSTTGVIQQRARPVLTTIDGSTYYEVITFSKS